MSKKQHIVKEAVMDKILTGNVKMKPRWYFVLGSLAMLIGVIGTMIVSIFLISLSIFSLRTHGPMGAVRYSQLISSFPWWAPFFAIIGIVTGISLLKSYDFSYKKNFPMIIVSLIIAVFCTGWFMDFMGMNAFWSRQGSMRRLYLQIEGKETNLPQPPGWRGMQIQYGR